MKNLLVSLIVLISLLASCISCSERASSNGDVKKVAVILKATDSEFWQSMAEGARKFVSHNPGKVEVTIYGPPTEAHIAELVSILENVVSQRPDGILVAPPNADSIVAAVNDARNLGIPVVTADNSINTEVNAHIATDNIEGGASVANALIDYMKSQNKPLTGSVAIVAPDVFEVIDKRIQGFVDRMKIIAPQMKILDPRYCDNDIAKSLNISQDIILSQKDLVAFYGANNHSADGVARALRETGKSGEILAVAYDSDPEEVQALSDSILNALIVQDPWALGYKGVEFVLAAINNEEVPQYFNPGVFVVTKENMQEEKMKAVLDPKLRNEY